MSDLEMGSELLPVVSNEHTLSLIRIELHKIIDEIKSQVLEQHSINEALLQTDQNINDIYNQFMALELKLSEVMANNNKDLDKNSSDLSLLLEKISKIPLTIEEKTATIAPKIAEQIIEKHTDCVRKFENDVNQCNNTLGALKQNTVKLQRWHAKRVAIICVVATIISIIASGSSTYFILQKYPPSHETRVLKANNVTANEKVYIFDVTGKFCGKARIDPSS